MSVSITRSDGVTVLTMTSDPKSRWPPLCQIFKGLCYSPVCCSVSQHLRIVQRTTQSLLGVSYATEALHLMSHTLSLFSTSLYTFISSVLLSVIAASYAVPAAYPGYFLCASYNMLRRIFQLHNTVTLCYLGLC